MRLEIPHHQIKSDSGIGYKLGLHTVVRTYSWEMGGRKIFSGPLCKLLELYIDPLKCTVTKVELHQE